MRRPRLIVMLKEPHAGRVKTRLGADIGMTAAAWWFRHQTRALLRRLDDPRWELVLAVSPDRDGMQSRIWPAHLPRIAQGQGDLGARMARQFDASGAQTALIIGADIPGITKRHIAQAFAQLRTKDAVIGPAPDGGYWCIGLRAPSRRPRQMFAHVRWSGPHALSDTCATMSGLRIAQLESLQDVDTVQDL